MYQAVIVDDEPLIVDGLVKAIEWAGFHIELGLATTDPQAALDYCLEHPVSILITDVSMPVISGLQLIQEVKAAKPSISCIVLSAYDNFEYARTALRYGAENYLLKPLDPDELSDTISQIISHIKEREQLNSTYGSSMMTFRSAFTEQWLKNLLSNAELSTKAGILGINLDAPNFTVAVFSCPNGGETMMSHFFDLLLQYLPGHYTGNFFFETPLRLVGVLSPISRGEEDTKVFLTPILKAATANGIQIFASIGTTVRDYSLVHQSYHQADKLAFLEYSNLSLIFSPSLPGLEENIRKALDSYDRQWDGSAPWTSFSRNMTRHFAAITFCQRELPCSAKKSMSCGIKTRSSWNPLLPFPFRKALPPGKISAGLPIRNLQ